MTFQHRLIWGIGGAALVYGVAMVIVAVITFMGAGQAEALLGVEDAQLTTEVMSVVAGIEGMLFAVAGVLGMRGAHHPEKLAPFITLATVLTAVSLVEIAMVLNGGSGSIHFDVVAAIWGFVGIVLASRARTEALAS